MAHQRITRSKKSPEPVIAFIKMVVRETKEKVGFIERSLGKKGAWRELKEKFPGAPFIKQHEEETGLIRMRMNLKAVAFDEIVALLEKG